ncbi:cortactin-binding protein 2 [Elysia marginata]|uniref:Cortactin-binding protein 2 n=1 Tax=Elysia marginata TaxID=1093978 RepID=A0AAV4FG39_9GAST|nr:cortactin-binding protein 2 [Elysia marginata]
MAARNLKPGSVQSYQSETEKTQPSTLKRQPNPDWSKNDLLRLLSYFEGELQARDITIATLKAEKAKQLLYQAKYGRFGLGDPFVALQRDAEGKNDTGFDEAAIKSMYDNQLAQLENLIATQRKAQLKMREQLGNSEKRFHKVCSELEDEKKKHAHDTAQGDDVTYMLEKERERLKAEIDFEKSQNKKLEKDLKKTLASLEEERANAARHKQVAIMLIKERKNLIERLVAENQLRDDMESALTDGKSRMQSMAEGLAEESKKSLKMEAALERQNQKFDGEREALKVRLLEEEKTTGLLKSEVTRLSQQLETLQQQVRGAGLAGVAGLSTTTSTNNPHLRASSSSPARVASPIRTGSSQASSSSLGVSASGGSVSPVSPNVNVSLPQVKPSLASQSPQSSSPMGGVGLRQASGYPRPVLGAAAAPSSGTGVGKSFSPQQAAGHYSSQHSGQPGRQGAASPDREVIYRPAAQSSEKRVSLGASPSAASSTAMRGSTPGRSELALGSGARVSIQQGSGAVITSSQHGGAKISFHVPGGGSLSPVAPSTVPVRRGGNTVGPTSSTAAGLLGRGVPPPIPPNKPNFGTPATKPSLPPKGSVIGAYGDVLEKFGPTVVNRQQPGSKAVQIPVKVMSSGGAPGSAAGGHVSGKHLPAAPSAGTAGIASVHTQSVVTTLPPAATPPISTDKTGASGSNPPALDSGPSLEFLGPEMANLQQLLATMTTGSTSASTSIAVSNPVQALGSFQLLQTAGSTKSKGVELLQAKVLSPQPVMKELHSYQHTAHATAESKRSYSSLQTPLTSPTISSTSSGCLSPTSDTIGKTKRSLPPNVITSVAATDIISEGRDSPRTVVNNSDNSRVELSSFTRVGESVPLHIYEDHSTATPSTYMTHHMLSPTSVTPSPSQPNASLAWPTISRSVGQITAIASTGTVSNSVITAQPLPSAPVFAAAGMPVSAAGSVAVGVVAPTVSLKPVSEVQQNKQAWTTPVFPGTQQPSQASPSIASTVAPASSSLVSPTSQRLPVRLLSTSLAIPGPSARLTVPDIIKQVSASNSHTDSSESVLSPKSKTSPSNDIEHYPLHNVCAKGDLIHLQNLLKKNTVNCNLPYKDGSTPLHYAVEHNQEVLESGANPSSLRDDRTTPLHIAALKGFVGCLRLLLAKGAAVNLANAAFMTPLLLAVKSGHAQCCQLLLRHGANVLFKGQDGLSSIHHAVQAGHLDTLRTLLDRLKLAGITRDSDTAHQLVAVTDHAGWTLAHMAAHLSTQDCLVMLSESLPLDFDATDKLRRTVREVASKPCKEILGDFGRPASPTLKVAVELRYILENTTVSNIKMGSMHVGPSVGWRIMEERLRATLLGYLAQLDLGLRTRRIARMEAEAADKDKTSGGDREFTLGLTMANIKQFEMGFYKWTPGMQTDTSPYLILCNNDHKKVTITVDDSDFMCELIAFDVLHPVSSINSYLRLMEQHKSVIFYGPAGSGKSYLAHKLAQSIAAQEITKGRKPSIYQLTLQAGFTYSKFLAFLKQRNCVVPVNKEDSGVAPILLLDNIETVDIAQLFGELLDPMEYRGIGHAFCLRGDERGNNGMHYLTDQFYVIGTMNKARSLGVDLSILPRFRWVQFRLDTEPLRGLLARHFLRRLCNLYSGGLPSSGPAEEDGADLLGRVKLNVKEGSGPAVLRTVEWIVCVWQRLNDSLLKLGLPEVVLGPCTFFRCPLERRDPTIILEWMKATWNQMIAPRVREAVKRGTGSEAASEGQQKVANTALYVLMQRSVILGCPLAGHEKDTYLAGFAGSNELDIPLRQQGGGAGRGYVKTRASLLSGSSPSAPVRQSRSASSVLQRKAGSSQSPARLTSTPQRARSVEATESHSLVSASSARVRTRNGHEDKESADSTSNFKRRSLSESNVDKAVKQEQQQQEVLDSLSQPALSSNQSPPASQSQAKVARLDVKPAAASKVINFNSVFCSPVTPQTWDMSPRTAASSSAVRKTGRVSPLFALVSGQHRQGSSSAGGAVSGGYKKSRSSENISSGASASSPARRGLSPGPFSFSLATPTSNLSSFKFLDKSTGDCNDGNQARRKGGKGEDKRGGKPSLSLADMTLPDFSVFDNVPTPTDEATKNRSFVFVGRPSPRAPKAKVEGRTFKREVEGGKEEVWSRLPEPEVWSKRTDGFVPIEKLEGNQNK